MSGKTDAVYARRLRDVCYLTAPVVFFAGVVGMSRSHSAEALVREGGFVEVFQMLLLLCGSSLLGYCAWRFPRQRAFLTMMAALAGLALLREMNNSPWYHRVFAYRQASTVFGGLVLGLIALRFGPRLLFQCRDAAGAHSFLYLCAGTIIVVGWAQVLAQGSLFQDPLYDRIVEECLETAGYMTITCGVFEQYLELRALGWSASAARAVPDRPYAARPANGSERPPLKGRRPVRHEASEPA